MKFESAAPDLIDRLPSAAHSPVMGAQRYVALLFALSGVSGLVYQVLWVRVFGNQFGNTTHSASVVTATFLLGLGVGSQLGGRWADIQKDPAKCLGAYGAVEVLIGLWGLGLAVAFPFLGELAGSLVNYRSGDAGFQVLASGSVLLRFALAVAVLLPPSMLMGTTLTLLIKYLVARRLDLVGGRVALLYGLNTLGAAAGAFSVDLLLVPTFGQFSTLAIAAALNLVAGVVALRWARGEADVAAGTPAEAPSEPARRGPPTESLTLSLVALGLLLTGLGGMGLEVLWFRFAAGLLQQVRFVFSLLLTVVLVGMGLGALLGGFAARKFRRPYTLFAASQALVILLSVLGLLSISKRDVLDGFYAVKDLDIETWSGAMRGAWWPTLQPIAFLCLLPSMAMGAAYPLANAAVQDVQDSLGRRAGLLYLANTVGAVIGSLATGLAWIPSVGLQGAAFILFFVITLGILAMALARWGTATRMGKLAFAAATSVALGGIVVWTSIPEDSLLRQTFLQIGQPGISVLTHREGAYQSVVVIEDPSGARTLLTDGHAMSANNRAAQRYMRAFAHIPLLQREVPKRALVICFGVGNTAHAASLHPLERLEIADISLEVLEVAHYFEATNGAVLTRDNVEVFVNDGRNHLVASDESVFDLVTMEPPPIAHAGVASLYTVEYYDLVRSRLMSGGFASQWLPAYQVRPEVQLAVIAAFLEVFPNAVLLSGAGRELVLLGQKDGPNQLDIELLRAALYLRPEVEKDLEGIGLSGPVEIAATYIAGTEVLRALVKDILPVTDDLPRLEEGPPRFVAEPLVADMFMPKTVTTWCPACFEKLEPAEGRRLRVLLTELSQYYRTSRFLSGAPPTGNRPRSSAQ